MTCIDCAEGRHESERLTVKCAACREQTTINHGYHAPRIPKHSYKCFRCRRVSRDA